MLARLHLIDFIFQMTIGREKIEAPVQIEVRKRDTEFKFEARTGP